ncbi:mitochondrial ribosomal protein L3 [Oratosquilla oratoria]|uniref:mitochondrial ribosomal protein L3 n=1 Tax=Oratosquilla oratoria TaxID=337810 RepID=UPI003F76CDF4
MMRISYIGGSATMISNLLRGCNGLIKQGQGIDILKFQVREMSRVKRRHTVPPFWLPKATRILYPEHTTPQNEDFITEYISDTYSSPLKVEPWERGEWSTKSVRCGLIARKIGIYPMWTVEGKRKLATLLHVKENHVVKYIPPEERSKEKYSRMAAVIVGAESDDPRKFTRQYKSIFTNAGILPKKKLTKFLVTPNAKLQPGTPLFASHFRPGDIVDIRGMTIDRGFQGVVKRWGFKGGRASHGTTKNHRRTGNIGGGGEKSRVWPGKKMPGHMGREHRFLRGLEVLRVNAAENVLWVTGPAVPGPTGAFVYIYDTVLPHLRCSTAPPFPTYFPEDEVHSDEKYAENIHVFSNSSITFT